MDAEERYNTRDHASVMVRPRNSLFAHSPPVHIQLVLLTAHMHPTSKVRPGIKPGSSLAQTGQLLHHTAQLCGMKLDSSSVLNRAAISYQTGQLLYRTRQLFVMKLDRSPLSNRAVLGQLLVSKLTWMMCTLWALRGGRDADEPGRVDAADVPGRRVARAARQPHH